MKSIDDAIHAANRTSDDLFQMIEHLAVPGRGSVEVYAHILLTLDEQSRDVLLAERDAYEALWSTTLHAEVPQVFAAHGLNVQDAYHAVGARTQVEALGLCEHRHGAELALRWLEVRTASMGSWILLTSMLDVSLDA